MPTSPAPSTTLSAAQETYKYTPTEQGIFSPSPYKDHLLPLWRFRTPEIARDSAEQIWSAFLEYEEQDDFVGMDNARKFLQMGMTRAKRYANHKGGRKYASGETARVEAEKYAGITGGRKKRRKLDHSVEDGDSKGAQEKEEASLIFREVWEKAKAWEGYVRRKEEFQLMQKEPSRAQKKDGSDAEKVKGGGKRKREPEDATDD